MNNVTPSAVCSKQQIELGSGQIPLGPVPRNLLVTSLTSS